MRHDLRLTELRDQFFRCALRNDASLIDDGDAIAEILGLIHVMRRQQDRAAARPELIEQHPQLAARLWVEPGGRFIEKQQIGVADDRTREREPLLLASGQAPHTAGPFTFELDDLQQLVDRPSTRIERSEQAERLLHRQLVCQLGFLQLDAEPLTEFGTVMGPAKAEHLDVAGIRRQQTLEDFDRRRLPGAVGTEQTEAFTSLHRQRQVGDGNDRPVRFSQPFTRHGVTDCGVVCCTLHCLVRSIHTVDCRLVSRTILIAGAKQLAALQQQPDLSDAEAFADIDALKALDAIMRERPQAIVLDSQFAASARGAAFINRVKAEPALAACDIRVLEAGALAPVPSPPPAAAPPAVAPPVPAPAPTPAPANTRRAERHVVTRNIEVLIDGNPATLVNISLVGAQVLSAALLRPNQRVRMSLVDATRPMRFNGVVAWAAFEMPKEGPRYRAGVNFYDAAPDMVARFIDTITAS